MKPMKSVAILLLGFAQTGAGWASWASISTHKLTRSSRSRTPLLDAREPPSVAQALYDGAAGVSAAVSHETAKLIESLTSQPRDLFGAAISGVRAGVAAFEACRNNATIIDVPSSSSSTSRTTLNVVRISAAGKSSPNGNADFDSTKSTKLKVIRSSTARSANERASKGEREKEILLRGPHSPLYTAFSPHQYDDYYGI